MIVANEPLLKEETGVIVANDHESLLKEEPGVSIVASEPLIKEQGELATNEPLVKKETGTSSIAIYTRSLCKRLKMDLEMVIMGEMLTDLHISAAQSALKRQFSNLNGLESTLYQTKKAVLNEAMVKNKLQIIHCKKRQHWIVATTVNSRSNEVKVFDSIFVSLDKETKQVLLNLFGHDKAEPKLKLLKSQKQSGSKDCGLFAVAYATSIAFGKDPTKKILYQDKMRTHLVDCLQKGHMSLFSTL